MRRFLVLATTAAATLPAGPAHAAPDRVPDDLLGVNGQVAGSERGAGAPAAMAELGVRVARIQVTWHDVQPARDAQRDWRATDAAVAALARAGIRAQPVVAYSALWAQSPLQRVLADQRFEPEDPATFADFAREVVERYGRGGAFWRAHPALDARPVLAVELWNEPNSFGYYLPRPDAARYGRLYRAARDAMRAADPRVVAVVGGLHTHPRGAPDPVGFLEAMGDPASIDAVGLHPYGPTVAELVGPVVAVRRWMDDRGLRDRPLLLTEWGWASSDDAARAALVREGASALLRTDCGVGQALLFAWVGDGHDLVDREGRPGAAAHALGAVARGEDRRRATLHHCARPAPDRDGDGVDDQHDAAPLDGDRATAKRRSRPRVHDAPWLERSTAPGFALDGRVVAGEQLVARVGTWNGSPRPALSLVRWEACDGDACSPLAADGTTLDLAPAHAGRRIRAVVAARNRLGRATATTPLSAPVESGPEVVAPPRVDGEPRAGRILSAVPASFAAHPAPDLGFRWLLCDGGGGCTTVGTGSTWRVSSLAMGRRVVVEATARNGHGSVAVRSEPTAPITL